MPNSTYDIGRYTALTKLGFIPSSVLKPMLGGAAFGGAAGAIASPEGHRGEGAIRGMALGGGLAAGGSAAGQAYKRMRAPSLQHAATRSGQVNTKARAAFARRNPGLANTEQAYEQTARGKRLMDLQSKYEGKLTSVNKLPTGLGMLGGVTGAGMGIAQTERGAQPTDAQDPYGYRYR